VIAYGVVQRVQEIGIRIALGANQRTVSFMVVREAAWLALAGIGLGAVGALTLQTTVSSFLFGITATDFTTFGLTVLVLAGTCLMASYIPARRASRVDPTIALRGN
jgi:ABC-type antimicrobial peptide transport system permease subunit